MYVCLLPGLCKVAGRQAAVHNTKHNQGLGQGTAGTQPEFEQLFFSVILARKLAAGLTRTHLSALLGCRNPIPDMVRPEAL